jgi:ribonuclease D
MSSPEPHKHLQRLRRDLTKDDINALPLKRYEGEILLVQRPEDLAEALNRLNGEDILGFDTETRPSFKKGVPHPPPALLQLASRSLACLIQLNQVGLPDPLIQLMVDHTVVKAGVAVRDDIRELWRVREFSPGGFLDLGESAKRLELRTNGLRNMAANMLGARISKRAQCSNWARRDLSRRQIVYAATDAWISRELYLHLHHHELLSSEDFISIEPGQNGRVASEAECGSETS